MDQTLPPCPQCASTFTYELSTVLVCPECAHEWEPAIDAASSHTDGGVIKDSVGNILSDGDTVTVIKTLKVKGSPTGIKAGTKVRNIRLAPGIGDHDIEAKVDGIGPMQLKSSVVKKI